ncbi:hypothetical protein [Streptomyces sp. NPDC054787]
MERALVLTSAGPLILLVGYQPPNPPHEHHPPYPLAPRTAIPGEAVIDQLVRTLVADVSVLNEKVAEVDRLSEDRFHAHDLAEIIMSMLASALSSAPSFSLESAATSPSWRPRIGSPPSPPSLAVASTSAGPIRDRRIYDVLHPSQPASQLHAEMPRSRTGAKARDRSQAVGARGTGSERMPSDQYGNLRKTSSGWPKYARMAQRSMRG